MGDPRDLGFNYGKGCGGNLKPAFYCEAAKRARVLGREAVQKASQTWALEMALWKVRIATTGAEKAAAIRDFATELKRAAAAAC